MSMQSITFTCETITPMFLAGADGSTPELRPPSIKGALRFWWRAMNGHLMKDKLREEEEKLFGGAGAKTQRSALIIKMPYVALQKDIYYPVAHKENMRGNAISPGQRFEVILMYREEPKKEYFKSLFILVSILGGLGKRSRRGMGSWSIKKIDGQEFKSPATLQEIHKYLSVITQNYRCDSRGIFCTYAGNMEKYPWISSIELSGKEVSLKSISKATHDVKDANSTKFDTSKYDGSMGHASRGRFASPVYVSMIKMQGNIPIITTLNAIPDKRELNVDLSVQRAFKEKIL